MRVKVVTTSAHGTLQLSAASCRAWELEPANHK